jgi:hypothetical protein
MNPSAILGVVIVVVAAIGGSFFYGVGVGKDRQEVADQGQFDEINKRLSDQKAEAAEKLRKAAIDFFALLAERDQLKTKLETEKAAHDKTTLDLNRKYSSLKLQFVAVQKAGGSGDGGGRAQGPAANPSGAGGPSLVQLPDEIAANLRQLAFDADQLLGNYALCYGWAQKVR